MAVSTVVPGPALTRLGEPAPLAVRAELIVRVPELNCWTSRSPAAEVSEPPAIVVALAPTWLPTKMPPAPSVTAPGSVRVLLCAVRKASVSLVIEAGAGFTAVTSVLTPAPV